MYGKGRQVINQPSASAIACAKCTSKQACIVMALSKLQTSDCPTIGSFPHQPRNITFPKVSFGKSKVVLRHLGLISRNGCIGMKLQSVPSCVSAFKQKKLRSDTADAAFITKGYQNWKDFTSSFRNHGGSACHMEVVEKMVAAAFIFSPQYALYTTLFNNYCSYEHALL